MKAGLVSRLKRISMTVCLLCCLHSRLFAMPQEISVSWSSVTAKISQKKETLVVGSGLGLDGHYMSRISDSIGLGASYALYTGAQGPVLHGPSVLFQYSILGQMPFNVTDGALIYQLNQPIEITLWAGPALRFYNIAKVANSSQTLASKDAAERSGSAWGTTAGLGVFVPLRSGVRLTCLSGIFLGKIPTPEVGSALAAHLSVGLAWGM